MQRIQEFFSAWRYRSVRDAAAVAGICIAIYAASNWFGLLNRTYAFAEAYKAYDVDDLIVVAIAFGFLMLIYSRRRAQDLKVETNRRREAEKYNADQSALLTTVFGNVSQGILMFDSDERLVVCNDHYLEMYGLSSDIVKPGMTLREILQYRAECGVLDGGVEEVYSEVIAQIAQNKTVSRIAKMADGREIAVTNNPMADGGWVATHEDRTESRRREESFQLLFDNNPVAMVVFDRETFRFLAVNDAAVAQYGYSRERFLAMTLFDIRVGEHESTAALLRALPEAQNGEYVGQHRRADGTKLRVVVYSRILNFGNREARLAAIHDVTERMLIESDLRRTKKFLDAVIDNVPLPIMVKTAKEGRITIVNKASQQLFGFQREQTIGKTPYDIYSKDRADLIAKMDQECLDSGRPLYFPDHALSTPKGVRMVTSTKVPIPGDDGKTEYLLTLIEDVTERRKAVDELHRTKMFLDTVIDNVPLPIVVKTVKDSRFVLINKASEEMHGRPREWTIGKTLFDMFPKERADIIKAQDAECFVSEQPVIISDHTIPTSKGDRIVVSKKVAIRGQDGKPEYLLTLLDDVTERRQAEQRITHMAHSDALTDLPNRAAFSERLSAILKLSQAQRRSFAVLCMDLDSFKEVNDIYGHAVGDTLLCMVADRLRSIDGDIYIARLGGDEFTIIAENGERSSIGRLTDRLLAAFADDFEIEGHRLVQDLSIGVAIYPAHGTDDKTLMKNADAALYHAKSQDSGSVQYFEAEMDARSRERNALKVDLDFAIARNEIQLHYQPQLKMTGETTGFEALARWHSPKRGIVSPAEFIPLAEESSLILVLGERVLREACREAASWDKPLKVAVNVSPIQFRHGDLPRLVHSVLMESGLEANRLELEITEGVLIDDFSRAVSILRRLKALGVQIVLDDFGTGYSSLSYLRAFPFDKLKIDRSFIADLEGNQQSIAIVQAVIGLCRSLKIPVLAEGVETKAQHAFLTREGCDEVQGYLTGRPLAIADYAAVVGKKLIAETPARVRSIAG